MRPIDAEPLESLLELRSEQLKDTYGNLGGAAAGAKCLIMQQPSLNIVCVGEWVINEADTEWKSHKCSVCGKPAIHEENCIDEYDEGYDGESYYSGQLVVGITEHLTPYCPFCGNIMKNYVEDQTNV